MTIRHAIAAAALLLSATTAFAGDISTDSARARAAQATHASRFTPIGATESAPASTDEARALAEVGPTAGSCSRGHMAAADRPCGCHHG